MNSRDKIKVQTAITIFLEQNPEGLTAEELSEKICSLPLGIRQSRGGVSRSEIAAILKTWKGFGRNKGVIYHNKRNNQSTIYTIDKVRTW